MRHRPSPGKPTAAINITPYIDILLVLLIIFMVIQPATQYELGSRAPAKALPTEGSAPSAVIVVSVDNDFAVSINSQPVPFPKLGQRLFDILSARSDRTVFVKGAPDLPFGAVAQVIDVAKGAGAGDVGLM
jgi:biopolymer transport protein TolR